MVMIVIMLVATRMSVDLSSKYNPLTYDDINVKYIEKYYDQL
jgi:hypothetical protein